jgi:CRP-like cAMP-binding protein
VPRTATVTAIGEVAGFQLSAAAFRAAIAGPTSAAAAREVAAERLSRSAD